MLSPCSKHLTNIMVSTSTHGVGSDVESPMMSLSDDVMTNDSNLQCPHCNFRCNSATTMTQHSWEEHPLLMRRKKHLIPSSKMDAATSSHSDETIHDAHTAFMTKTPSPVNETAHEMQNCSLSGDAARLNPTLEDAEVAYRNNARRSLSLLTTAADLLERQSADAPQRHVAVVKPQPVEAIRPFPQYDAQPLYAPLYNVYVPGLNQFVTIPIAPGTMVPYPGVLNTRLDGAVKAYMNSQPPNTQLAPRADQAQYFPRQKLAPTSTSSKLAKPTSGEIRSLLQTTKKPVWKMAPLSTSISSVKVTKPEPVEPASATPTASILDKERVQALEKAILSTDCCDINDTSTTMPFKCSDGVWRMVTFKCIKGLWVVQTPDSSTPTVYVPCDETIPENESPSGRAVRSLSDVGHKRKLSDGTGSDVDAKRLCASAPVFNLTGDSGSGISLKRTLSNPFITKSLPAPSQHFTNNEGKKVNISVIKRNSPRSNSCNLIKSLLLRKPITPSSTRTVSSSSGSVTSSSSGEISCKVPERPPINLAQSILRSSLAY